MWLSGPSTLWFHDHLGLGAGWLYPLACEAGAPHGVLDACSASCATSSSASCARHHAPAEVSAVTLRSWLTTAPG